MPVWPGDPDFRVEPVCSLDTGEANVTAVSMSLHTGTHVDAPLHYLAGGVSIDCMPLDATIGPARVLDRLESHRAGAGERLLLKTPPLSPDAARVLADAGVRAVGIEGLTIGGAETHRILLGAGVWVIEGLDLSAVEAGEYDLVCLPLKVTGAEGAPARAALRRR
jgi:arylformamidase